MYATYQDQVGFLFVYIREAHPSDGWQMPANEKERVVFEQPRSHERRRDVAGQCCATMKLSMPCVVDGMDNAVDDLYAGWPERMFVIDAAGRIAYAGRKGPWGFKPDEVRAWLEKHVPPHVASH